MDTQPSVHRHLDRGWPVHFEDGRGLWSEDSTRLRASDWYDFRDPGQMWERPFYQAGTAYEQLIEGAVRTARRERVFERLRPGMGRLPAQAPPGAGVHRARHLAGARERRARHAVRHRHALRRAGSGDEAAPGPGPTCCTAWTSKSSSGTSPSTGPGELPERRRVAAGAPLRRTPARDAGLGRARDRRQPVLRAHCRTVDPARAADALRPFQRRHHHPSGQPCGTARVGVGARLDGRVGQVPARRRNARGGEPRGGDRVARRMAAARRRGGAGAPARVRRAARRHRVRSCARQHANRLRRTLRGVRR